MTDRRFDIVLFGATGFTGELVAEYLAKHAPRTLRWALAGRNEEKLERVRSRLAAIESSVADMPILIADGLDRASLEALVPQAKVVCTTVGPYLKYGAELAAACARHGTHYCDLTGEVPFMRASIDANDEAAKASGARIVHACGFDSIPSDLGVHMVWDHAKRVHGRPLAWAKSFVGPTKGTASGGTVASMIAIMDLVSKDASARRLVLDPHALDPRCGERRRERTKRAGIHFDADAGAWVGPFFMAVVNAPVVRRSDALLDHAYGPSFRYTEEMRFGRGPRGFVKAYGLLSGLGALMGAASVPVTRGLLVKTVLPKPGEGPSRAAIENGFFKWRILAETDADGGGRGARVEGRIEAKGDPGYGATALMLGEAALALALDEAELPARAGVLTPATAMGMVLVERLRRAGMVFEVGEAA